VGAVPGLPAGAAGLTGPGGSATYGNAEAWQVATRRLMGDLVDLLAEALPDLPHGCRDRQP